jgi:hypothetical protein
MSVFSNLFPDSQAQKQARLLSMLITEVHKMSEIIDRLAAEVEENNTVIGSAVTLIRNLVEEVRNAPDMTAVAALADTLSAHTDALAEVVAANTPGASEQT